MNLKTFLTKEKEILVGGNEYLALAAVDLEGNSYIEDTVAQHHEVYYKVSKEGKILSKEPEFDGEGGWSGKPNAKVPGIPMNSKFWKHSPCPEDYKKPFITLLKKKNLVKEGEIHFFETLKSNFKAEEKSVNKNCNWNNPSIALITYSDPLKKSRLALLSFEKELTDYKGKVLKKCKALDVLPIHTEEKLSIGNILVTRDTNLLNSSGRVYLACSGQYSDLQNRILIFRFL